MLDTILRFDYWLFELINIKGHTALLDVLMPFIRNPYFWVPLYTFIAFFMLKNFGNRAFLWILFFLLTFMLCDAVSATFLKPFIGRLRPCQDYYWYGKLKLLVDCGSGKSFPSSHATNHFGISVFIYYTLKKYFKRLKIPVMLWATIVSFAQVYVGVHYPLDVVAGGVLGCILGAFCANYFNLRIGI